MAYIWKQFTRRIPIKAPPKAIYDAWSTQQGLESWFLCLAQFTNADGVIRSKTDHVQTGDQYKLLWHGYADDTVEEREVLAANGWDNIRFRFSGGCIVTVSIKQEEGET